MTVCIRAAYYTMARPKLTHKAADIPVIPDEILAYAEKVGRSRAESDLKVIHDAFYSVLPPQFARTFESAALARYQEDHDVHAAIDHAIATAVPELPPVPDAWDRAISIITECVRTSELQQELKQLSRIALAEGTGLDFLLKTAEGTFTLREAVADLKFQFIRRAIKQLPANTSPVELSQAFASFATGSTSRLQLQQQETPFSEQVGQQKEDQDDAEGSDEDEGRDPGVTIPGPLEFIGDLLNNHPKLRTIADIVLEALGLTAIMDIVLGDEWLIYWFKKLMDGIRERDAEKIRKALEGLIKRLTKSKAFRKKLIKRFGLKQVLKLLSKVLARCLPFIGWAVLVGALLFEVYRHWDDLMDP